VIMKKHHEAWFSIVSSFRVHRHIKARVPGIARPAVAPVKITSLRKDRMVNNDENASSSDAIDGIVFRLKCIGRMVRQVHWRVNIGFLDDSAPPETP
jgi:hypothetical protein